MMNVLMLKDRQRLEEEDEHIREIEEELHNIENNHVSITRQNNNNIRKVLNALS
jgi:molybdopterin biosynthesis enzyme MoaB